MVFPKWLQAHGTIAVTAPSDSVKDVLDERRFLHAKRTLEDKGHSVEFTPDVFCALKTGENEKAGVRAKELNELFRRTDVEAVVSAKGGTYLVEILDKLDFETFVRHPKWIQGYSDNTALLFPITTKYDVATVYGCNFGDFGMEPWEASVENHYQVLRGARAVQKSFAYYQDGFGPERTSGLEGYTYDREVCWKCGGGESSLKMEGRLIGGCADVLFFLGGTRYDGALEFCERYREDGILWYLESFLANDDDFVMQLWRLKELGWFRHARGILFGRPCMYESWGGRSYEDTVRYRLGDLGIPLVFDADIGHKGPQLSMINGAYATVQVEDGRGTLTYRTDRNGNLI